MTTRLEPDLDWVPAARATGPFVALSIALHVALILGVGRNVILPAPAFVVALPNEVELGFVDSKPAAPPAPVPSTPGSTAPRDEGLEPAPAVARSVEDSPTPGAPPPSSEPSPFGTGFSASVGAGGIGLGGGGPRGTMIALQVDLDRVRQSKLAADAHLILDLMPAWRPLLAASGLDPVESFRRLAIATPDLGYGHVVLSGRARGGAAAIRDAAERLARADRGVAPVPGSPHGPSVLPWPGRDGTMRVAALVGPDGLAIAPREDLARVLAVAVALGARNAQAPGMDRSAGAASLLAMREDETVALSVEGMRNFVVAATHAVPLTIRLSLGHIDEFQTELRVDATYGRPSEAKQSLAQLAWLRRAWAAQPDARPLGLAGVLDGAEVLQRGSRVELRVKLTLHQVRYLVSAASRLLRSSGSAALPTSVERAGP